MFTSPAVLSLLILIPIFVLFFLWRGWVRSTALHKIGNRELLDTLLTQISPLRRRLKSALWLIALAALIIALARPTWGTEQEIIRGEGIQIVVVLDISRSMDATDILPSRLQRAKADLEIVLNTLERSDVGIVLFARRAFVYMPMTYDTSAARVFLDGANTDAATLQGTNLTDAIEQASNMFTEDSTAGKLLILITDGENHEGNPIAAAEDAAAQDIVIHTLGYATEDGATVPIYDAQGNLIEYRTYDDGTLVTTTLNEEILQQIAITSSGTYQRVTPGSAHLQPLLDAVEEAQSGALSEQITQRPVERFGIFIALALLALSAEILLPETRRTSL